MKKIISLGVTTAILTTNVFAGSIGVFVNNNKINAEAYIDQSNRTLVPIRFVADNLGAETKWDAQTKTAKVTKENKTIEICIPCKKVTVNGYEISADSFGSLKNNRTYVPLRLIAENFDAEVKYEKGNVYINTKSLIQDYDDIKVDTSKMQVIENFEFKGRKGLEKDKYLKADNLDMNVKIYRAYENGFGLIYDKNELTLTNLILEDGTWIKPNSSSTGSATYLGNYIGKTVASGLFTTMRGQEILALVVPINLKIEKVWN